MHFLRIVPALVALVFICGCGGDPLGRQALSGAVKVDGAPLAKGNIAFQPTEGQPTAGGAAVTSGSYKVPREGGLVAGKYRVVINAPIPGTGGKADENAMPGDPPAPPKELIPPDWNVNSQQMIEVKKEGPFVFDFEVKTKK